MSSAAMLEPTATTSATSAEEWQLRCELAAAYQLADLYGMSDLAATHISVRLPSDEHHFLVDSFGMLFDEITASSLIKVRPLQHASSQRETRSTLKRDMIGAPGARTGNVHGYLLCRGWTHSFAEGLEGR